MRAVLVLLNGLPGSGKSTLARAWCERRAADLPLALDVDVLRSMLGGWRERLQDAGLAARDLAIAAAGAQLRGGRDVVVPQFLVRPEFADRLTRLAREEGAAHLELVLDVPVAVAAARLAGRATGAEGALETSLDELAAALERFVARRPAVQRLRGSDPLDELEAAIARASAG